MFWHFISSYAFFERPTEIKEEFGTQPIFVAAS